MSRPRIPAVFLRLLTSSLVLTLALGASIAQAEPHPAPTTVGPSSVKLGGEGLTSIELSAADLAALPHIQVEAVDHGETLHFEGIPLAALLEKVGAPHGEQLRGNKMNLVLAVDAADGYRAVFALAELDPAFTDKVVILADRREGQPLNDQEGPLRIVADGEKRQSRWVRQVSALTVLAVK